MSGVKPSLEEVFNYYGGQLPGFHKADGLKVRCPFHDDSNASAVFNEQRQTFRCFACPAGGDSWQLIMDQEGLDFRGAVEMAVQNGWIDRDENGELSGGHAIWKPDANPSRGRRMRRRRRRRR